MAGARTRTHPIVDIMITYGVLRAVVRLLDRRGRGMRTNPHLIAIVAY